MQMHTTPRLTAKAVSLNAYSRLTPQRAAPYAPAACGDQKICGHAACLALATCKGPPSTKHRLCLRTLQHSRKKLIQIRCQQIFQAQNIVRKLTVLKLASDAWHEVHELKRRKRAVKPLGINISQRNFAGRCCVL